MNERLGLLASMPVFGGLNDEALLTIIRATEPIRLEAGAPFFREGDKSQAMYVLESGRAGIYKTWRDTETLLRTLKPGDCFGEMALIDLFPRSATVIAAEACTALQITVTTLQNLHACDVEQFTLLQMNMGRELSRRLRVCMDRLFRLQMGERLTGVLLDDPT